ncbi:conserved hypothetical protein [Ricinus communis]|uniref:Uncharacterized protein n=1 Tax=Ricinus communis TaxID=3988 RepID=B9SXT0_RICCO|nr:conserved hypothetical protein [Ricinus communis]
MAMDWQVRRRHIYKEANPCTDWLTTMAFTREMRIEVFLSPPTGLSLLLLYDVTGINVP